MSTTSIMGKQPIFNAGVESLIQYADGVQASTPEIKLLFSPFGVPFVPIEILGTNANKIISSLTFSKDRNNPDGILQVTITPDTKVIDDIVKIIDKVSFNLYSSLWGELGVDLEDLFKPMTLCQLWIDGLLVTVGTVRSCNRSASVSNTSKDVSYSLTIDGLGNMYNLNTVSLDLNLLSGMVKTISDSFNKAFELTATLKGGLPLSAGINAVLSAFKATTLEAGSTLSDGLPLALRLLSTPTPYGGIALESIASAINIDISMFQLNSKGGGQASAWSFLKNMVPSPWMEFFTETGGRTMVTGGVGVSALAPGFNFVVSRTAPYSNPLLGTVNPRFYKELYPWTDLSVISMLIGGDFVIITDDTVLEKTLGVDSVNQKTIFHTKYTNGGAMQGNDYNDKPIISVGPLNPFASGGNGTFGNREMFNNIECTSMLSMGTAASAISKIAKNTGGFPTQVITKNALSSLASTWYRNQSRFREGTVTVKGLPQARAGMYCLYMNPKSGKKAENMRDIGIYYIDSLSHSYNLDNSSVGFTTTLNLIRGVPLPASAMQTAMLLFDFEVLPPMTGFYDGEYSVLKAIRQGV